MIRGILAALALVTTQLGGAAAAGERAVVIELYTSQGCSSCPPADVLLGELASRDDVIPLALHVDYWDYIGWKDEFAIPAHTTRQRGYARAAGARTIYTPQMIVGGVDHVIGYKPMQLAKFIEQHLRMQDVATITLSRDADTLSVALSDAKATGEMEVQLIRYAPERTVDIARGENRGRRLTYHNIVTGWTSLGSWDGSDRMALDVEVSGDDAIVVLLQQGTSGPILAAARLR